jgi:hypothetical protein
MTVKMPEPVAYMSANGYLMNFTSHPENHSGLITIEQAEAYAQAVLDEALEQAAKRAESMHHDSAPYWVALRIRELKKEQS